MKKNITLAHISELEVNSSKVILHEGNAIALFRLEDGFFAIENRCPHRGGSLGEGKIVKNEVTCPWHQWKFDIKTGISTENINCSVKTLSVFIEQELIKLSHD
tara:strand:+ start:201 stop:509 length:309 start_codon:yes stop_codon:yes gene_type:complete